MIQQDPKDNGPTTAAREEKRTVSETTEVTPAPVTQTEETRTVTEESKSTVAPPTPQQ